ncbi:MAG TPA: malto-oligosyltrehalose synthase, partial [Pedococcus sp.]|nr:malto-oligosyltrehalose synthase [Pedococcus sp.]
WRCAGTTGYDTLLRVQQVFLDPRGEQRLTALADELLGEHQDLVTMVQGAKKLVVREVQAPEVARLMRLVERIVPREDPGSLRRALESLLTAMDRYRAYLVPGEPADPAQLAVLAQAEARAAQSLAAPSLAAQSTAQDDGDALAVVAHLVAGGVVAGAAPDSAEAQHELMVRFQQTCGPVMAKAVEDTTFYRHARLTALNEVGGNPARLGIEPAELHAFAERQLASWPTTMTTLSTHDTKRSEDVRARLGVLAEMPDEWRSWVLRAWELAARARRDQLDAATEYLLWQTLVGAWPISTARLQEYATKAVREAKVHTSWLDPDDAYEQAVATWVSWVTTDPSVGAHVEKWVTRSAPATRSVTLGQKLLQLVMPGVPDVYQGAELVDLTLVDPDNRRVVDFAPRRERLTRLDAGGHPADLDDEKLLVTSRALRLRREQPGWFTGPDARYAAVPSSSEHALCVGRGDSDGIKVVAVMTRFAHRLDAAGGWGTSVVDLPAGSWRDVLTGRTLARNDGEARLANVLADLPVALLVRHGSLDRDEHA